MVEAARRNRVAMQVGTQARSAPMIRRAIEKLRAGAIGEVIVATLSAGSAGRPGIVVRETASGWSLVWWMDGVAINAAAPLGGDGRVALLRRPGRAVG
jgi:predicted dehydrogenase